MPTVMCRKPIPDTGVFSWTAWVTIPSGGHEHNDGQVGLGPSASEYTVLQDNGYLLGGTDLTSGLEGYQTGDRVTVTADMTRRIVHFFVERKYVVSARIQYPLSEQLFFMIWSRNDSEVDAYEMHCVRERDPPPLPPTVSVYISKGNTAEVQLGSSSMV